MARAIDKQTVLDLIIEAKRADPETGSFAEWLAEYLVEHLPTLTPPNEWVSVEDGLPENYTDVLCWYEYFRYGDHNQMYQTCGIGYCINGKWGGEVSNGTKCKVLYWQPLPTPPYRRPLEGGEDT